ncbi:MAG: CpsD/CapB family tyrosine-protein kinase [Gammaproteobacteria bacterium]|nr:CpsD/CapB family tyrosine-protein kinase [Gammaproteobacteria bacterium]
MERIQKALDQAEQQRTTAKPSSSQRELRASVKPVEISEESKSPKDVHYSRTKVVDISAQVLEQNRLVAALPDHELTDVYRILRTRVLQTMNSNRWNALAVTSPATGSGKTLTSINLAISLAREVNRTVLLADFDLRHPSIHGYFGYKPELGLSDYLLHDAPLDEILISPSIERLVVLPGRESIHNSSEMLRSPKMIQLVEELKGRYTDRLIIFDLPPILAVDDALAFAPYTDAMLMIAEHGGTKRDDLEEALEILKNTPLIGTVLNKSDAVSPDPYGKK